MSYNIDWFGWEDHMNAHTPMPRKPYGKPAAIVISPHVPLHRHKVDESYSSFGSSLIIGIFAVAVMGWLGWEVALPAIGQIVRSVQDGTPLFHLLGLGR